MFATLFVWNDIYTDIVTFIKSVSALTKTMESTLPFIGEELCMCSKEIGI